MKGGKLGRARHPAALAFLFVAVAGVELGLRWAKLASSMRGIEVRPGMVAFRAEVNKPSGWVQVAVCPRSIYWLAPDAMLVTACPLTGLQRALRLAGIPPDGLVFARGREGPFRFEVRAGGRRLGFSDLFGVPEGDVVRVRDLVFVGASKLTRLMLREMELGLCATCPLRGEDMARIYADFVRPSGEAGFVLKGRPPLRRGASVLVVLSGGSGGG